MNPVREERAAASAGAPLPGEVRGRMERQLGANLGNVKVHTGGESAEAASKLGARAFAVGEDVHFNASQFAPGSKEGDRLLAHELTHVVQGQKSVKSKFADENAFVAGAAARKFDPNSDIDERKSMRGSGGINETWWFPSNEANAVDLDSLRQALYIQDNPNYAKGAVRFDMDPTQLKDLDIKLYKPTAFDGMMQGWSNHPWWVTKPGPWGITKNNTHEAVMQSQQFRFFKKRTLLMPTAPAAPAAGGGAGRPGGRP